ncbi:CHAT domain-containing protein [Kribbella sp. WER1]
MSSAAVGELLAEPDTPARLERLRAHGLATAPGVTGLLDEVEQLVHVEPAAAGDVATVCRLAAEDLGNDGLTARACYLLARVLADRAEFDHALALIDEARRRWWETGAQLSGLRTDLGKMQILDDLGRHHEAAEVAETLLAQLETVELGDDPEETELSRWLHAAAQENLGVARGFLGQQEEALAACLRAEAEYDALGLAPDAARARANRGIELLDLGRANEALAALESAEQVFRTEGDRLWSAKCAGHRADVYRQTGDLIRALRLLESAYDELQELEAVPEAIRLQLAIAGTCLDLGLYDEALAAATTVAEHAAVLGMRHDVATARLTRGLAQLGAGRAARAEPDIRTAAELAESVGDDRLRAQIRLAEAELAAVEGRSEEAARLAEQAAAELLAGNWTAALVSATLRRIDLALDDEAAGEALDAVEAMLEEQPYAHLRYPFLLRAARRHLAAGRRAEAEECLREATDEVERMSGVLPDHTMRLAFRTDRLAAYDELVALLVDRGAADEARMLSDRAKARTLIDRLNGAIRPAHHSAELRPLLADLAATYNGLTTTEHPQKRAALQRRANELEDQLGLAQVRLAAREKPVAAPAEAVGPVAPAPAGRAAIVTFHTAGDDLLVFVERSGRELVVRRKRGVLPALTLELDHLGAQWSRFRLGDVFTRRHADTLVATTNQILGRLYRAVIAPIRDLLDATTGRSLIVVPDRRLYRVPFHALYDGSAHLNSYWDITVKPARGGPIVASGDNRPGRHSVVFAVADVNAPSVGAEADTVGGLLPNVRVYGGPEATSAALFRELAGGPAPAVLHIACHGLYRPGNPAFSSLGLADRWVTAAELLDLDLRGTLVTLSACESGRHENVGAEPVGLAWAFLAAGASGAVVSQWLVSDTVTVDLMAAYYRALADGSGPAAALRVARAAVARRLPHPFHWAPFSYVEPPGTTNPAPSPTGVNR